MSSSQDNKSHTINTNSGEVSEEFNRENALADKIQAASPEAQQKIKDRMELSSERYEKEKTSQRYNHHSRVAREENRLLKKYFHEDVQRPNTPEAKIQDMQHIERDAEARVTDREAYYLEQIQKQSESDVRHIISKDRQQAYAAHQHSDQEQER